MAAYSGDRLIDSVCRVRRWQCDKELHHMDASNKIGEIAVQLQNLSPEEKPVLRLRFALDGSYNHALQDIADGLRVTKDEVRAMQRAERRVCVADGGYARRLH